MSHYHVYGVGNALVDFEFEVDDALLGELGIEKSVMTLIDEGRPHRCGHADPEIWQCAQSQHSLPHTF